MVSSRIVKIKIEVEEEMVNIDGAYIPQAGCNLEKNKIFEVNYMT